MPPIPAAASLQPGPSPRPAIYPDSDGLPMAENTLQYEWIVLMVENFRALLVNDFVAGDVFWYPVEGHPEIRVAPDLVVALGRPPGHRSSYMQWVEGGLAPQIVGEIWSPGNTFAEQAQKLRFYDRHGVQEFYAYDPDRNTFSAFLRGPGGLEPVSTEGGLASPLTGVRFVPGDVLKVLRPDGKAFISFPELTAAAATAAAERDAATAERDAATAERDAATAERDAATAEDRQSGV